MAKGMKKSANEKLRDKYGLTNVKSEPVTKKQKEVAVTQSATGGRKSSLQGAAIGTSKPTTPKKPAQIKAQDSPLLSAAKRFVSNPVGTVSNAVMKPIDDITERITSPSKKLKQEQNRLTQNQKQANSKQTDVGRLLGGMAVKAADDVVSGVAGLGDMTLGTAARAFGWENNPFSQWNKLAQTTQQANREYYSKNTANAGKVVQTVDELGTALVEALPQLAIAYMTAGGSLATEGAGAIAQATGRLAGTEAAQAASKLPGAIKTARAVANNLKTDPQFWTSFADMSGRYYNDAKQDGADDWTATMYALATGIMNAGIESGGGIQKLPGEMKKTERSLLSLIKSAHEEGTEEPIQGIIERASQNLILGKENPLFSLTDENAVFNPKTAAKEYGTGAAVGFGLGAVPAIRRGIQNSTNQPTPDMIAEVVKATPDPARAMQNLQAMQTKQAEQNAVQATPVAQTANSTLFSAVDNSPLSENMRGNLSDDEYFAYRNYEQSIYSENLQSVRADIESGLDRNALLGKAMDAENNYDALQASASDRSYTVAEKRQLDLYRIQYALYQNAAENPQETVLEINELLSGDESQQQVVEQPVQQTTTENPVTPESSVPQRNGLPEGQGAMSPAFPYREAQTQTVDELPDNAANKARDNFLRKSQQRVPTRDEVSSGTASWHGIPIKYTPNAHYEAENLTSEIRVSNKLFDLDNEGQRTVLDHEAAHNISDEMIKSEDWESLSGIFLKRTPISKEAAQRARNAKINVFEDENGQPFVYEGLQGELGSNAILESTTDAINAWFHNPSWLKDNHEEAYNFITDFMAKRGESTGARATPEPVSANNAQTEQPANPVTPESSVPQRNGLPEGQGAMSAQFPYREAPSQTNSLDSSLTPEERQMDGMEITHQVRTDADVDAHAKERFDFDYDGEKQDLFDGDGNWDAVDTALAEMIIANEVIKANQTGDYSEVIRLRRLMAEKNNTNWGQVGHTLARYANTPEAQIADAAETLDGYGLKESKKTKVMGDVQKEAYALANAKRTKNADNIIDFIKRMNAKRRTGGLFTPKRVGNTLVKALESEAQKEGGFDFLCSIADAQLRNFVTDNAPLSPIEAIKSVRYQSMLSKLTTVMRNLVGNGVFDPSEVVSNDIGVFADLFMSLRTGRRTTALASPVAGKTKWRGRLDAMQRAYIETALDADISGAENRFEKSPGRTFKMASRNPLTRFLSTVEKWQSYALNVTDEFQKGGIEAETQRGINSLERRGLLEPGALDGWAEETARERTFQNEGRMANAFLGARNALNELASVQDSRGGSFGLGDAVLPFARVPANVVGQFLNYSPLGFVKGAKQMLGVMAKGSKATAQEQAAAARAFGRGINGTAILTFFAAAAANGLLNVADGGDDDDEKDLARLRQTEGITGTQFNLSAAQRWLDGESTEWRNDDDLMNIGFLEPINGLMALGSLIWDSAQDDDGVTLRDVTNATAESTLQALSDLPAVSSITNIFNNYRYSTADDTAGKIGETATRFLGDTATSIIPNALSGIAQGMDEGTVRDTYSSEKSGIPGVLENTLNAAKAKIPGEKGRESLPTSLDNFGQERKTTASSFMNWLNSNILPGSITKYQTNAVKQELERLMESGADVSIPNRSAEKKVDTENGEKKLTYAEKRAYQKAYGGETFKGLNELFQSSAYKSLTNDEKAEAEKNVVSFATAKAKQKVGGKAEDPSWVTKSDGTMAQNAVYNAQYKTARNTAKQATGKDSPSDGDVLISLSNRDLDYDTTVKIMAQFMEPSTIKKYETAYADGYDFGLSAAFSGAYYEKSYDFGTTDSGNPKQRGKDGTIQWAVDNLGLTKAQATMLYNYLIKR